jgi:endonuclease YncB( thermonuclease family)
VTRFLPILRDLVLVCLLLGLLLMIALRIDPGEQEIDGPFHVIDGDTLASNGERLRLVGIDAPEIAQVCRDETGAGWRCGLAARTALSRLIAEDGQVRCHGSARDRYHRRLVECVRGEDSLNGQMVFLGFAVASGGYTQEEAQARRARRGIWAGEFDMPRQWRREHDTGQAGNPLRAMIEWLKDVFGQMGL